MLTCLNLNLPKLARPVVDNLDPESVSLLTKLANPQCVGKLLSYLALRLSEPDCRHAIHYLKFIESLLIYQLEEIRKKTNQFNLREILFLLEQRLAGVFKTAEDTSSLLGFILRQQEVGKRRLRTASE